MGVENRDWYRDWWRKKTAYVERAKFRISYGELEREKRRQGWRRNWLMLAGVFLLLVFAVMVRRL